MFILTFLMRDYIVTSNLLMLGYVERGNTFILLYVRDLVQIERLEDRAIHGWKYN